MLARTPAEPVHADLSTDVAPPLPVNWSQRFVRSRLTQVEVGDHGHPSTVRHNLGARRPARLAVCCSLAG